MIAMFAEQPEFRGDFWILSRYGSNFLALIAVKIM
jgi:hypothetical protein